MSIPGQPTGVTSSLEEVANAANDAQRELDRLRAIIQEEVADAKREIEAKHQHAHKAALDRLQAARRALVAAQDETPDHPWTGKRVYRTEPQGRPWQRLPDKRVEGIIETRRSTTQFPGNTASYNLPRIGEGFVRLLKKDGTPGAKFDTLAAIWGQRWRLVEDEEATSP